MERVDLIAMAIDRWAQDETEDWTEEHTYELAQVIDGFLPPGDEGPVDAWARGLVTGLQHDEEPVG